MDGFVSVSEKFPYVVLVRQLLDLNIVSGRLRLSIIYTFSCLLTQGFGVPFSQLLVCDFYCLIYSLNVCSTFCFLNLQR